MNGYGIYVAIAALAAMAMICFIHFCQCRHGRKEIKKNVADHKTIRQEIKLGDDALQVQIDILKLEKK